MATRQKIGETGWVEYNRNVRDAILQYAGEEDKTVSDALADFITGEADPEEYGLVDDSEESEDSDDSEE